MYSKTLETLHSTNNSLLRSLSCLFVQVEGLRKIGILTLPIKIPRNERIYISDTRKQKKVVFGTSETEETLKDRK